jgi:hypothetical protein
MARRKIRLELLPQERAALLKWNFTPQVRDQLDACASSTDVATITLSPVDIDWLDPAGRPYFVGRRLQAAEPSVS